MLGLVLVRVVKLRTLSWVLGAVGATVRALEWGLGVYAPEKGRSPASQQPGLPTPKSFICSQLLSLGCAGQCRP